MWSRTFRYAVECEFLQPGSVGRPLLQVLPCDEGLRWRQRDDVAALGRVSVARLELVAHFARLFFHLLTLRDEQLHAPGGAKELDHGDRLLFLLETFPHRHDEHLVSGPGRALRGGIEASQRLDHVANELDAHGLGVARGEDVHDPAAYGEGAVLIHRVFTREPGVDEQIGEVEWFDLRTRLDRDRRAQQAFRRTDAGKQRGRGRDDQARAAGGRGMERPRTGRRDAEVRGHAAIRVDLQ